VDTSVTSTKIRSQRRYSHANQVRRLRRENERLPEELEILRKVTAVEPAAAFFAKERR
jgi:transposase-like protein